MKRGFLSFTFKAFGWGFCFYNLSAPLLAQNLKPTPADLTVIQKPEDPDDLLKFNYKQGRNSDTLRAIDLQNRKFESGERNSRTLQESYGGSQSRAQDMVNMIKDEEMQKALVKVTARGKQMLQENPDIKSPLGIIAGAVSLWYGKTVRLIKHENFKLDTRVEVRGRAGEFSMESPILNGRLRYDGGGAQISMNRKISSIDTQAELFYNLNNQSFSTQLRHNLIPNVDLTFGASQPADTRQTDGRAGVEYRLDF